VARRIGLLGFLLLGSATAALAEGMVVEAGDVLRVTVAGAPDISREDARVDADGRIMLPGVGGIAVAGSDLDTIRETIAERLVAQDLLRQPTVMVEIAKYRSFYVGGAVAKPGAVDFEPGLTVRHALILAGGLDGKGAEKMTTEELVELKTKWRTTNYALLQVESRIKRLEAELDH
jgi:polysaccharide export outer membrane protein